MNRSETDSAVLDCALSRIATDPVRMDSMQDACLTLEGAKETAAFLRKHDAALAAELSNDALAGLLMHEARCAVGTFANVREFARR